MSKLIDLTGQKFYMLSVVGKSTNAGTSTEWECVCDCGKRRIANSQSLREGKVKSCGCFKVKPTGRPKQYNKYQINNNVVEVFTSNTNNKFMVDIDDFEKIQKYTWYESSNGYIETGIAESGKRKRIFLHRLIMNVADKYWVETIIDHINGNKRDNRKSNLRICTNGQNQINRNLRIDNTAGYTGVTYEKRWNGAWKATINVNSKRINLGSFKTKEEAIIARKEAENLYYNGIKQR
jgi:hypothetical protein